jgi:Holliday junction resolvase-like predicted endonuclease
MPHAYRKGYRAEKKVRRILEQAGYHVVESRGSHGPVDLVALRDDYVLLVQVKCNRSPSKKEEDALRRVPGPLPVQRWVCVVRDREDTAWWSV